MLVHMKIPKKGALGLYSELWWYHILRGCFHRCDEETVRGVAEGAVQA